MDTAEQTASTAVATIFDVTPALVLTDEKKYSEFYERMKASVADFTPDTSTATGRKAIAAMAFKVTRTKTAIDEAGKKMTEDARKQIAATNAQRTKIWDELDALAADVRKPLTAWEEAEKARQAEIARITGKIDELVKIPGGTTSEEIADRIGQLAALEILPAVFGDLIEPAQARKLAALDDLADVMKLIEKAEADAAELERLRAEVAERQEQERKRAEEEQAAAEAAAAAKAEKDRQERAAQEAAAREEQRQRDEAKRLEEAKAQAAAEAARKIQEEADTRIAEAEAKRRQEQAAEEAARKAEQEAAAAKIQAAEAEAAELRRQEQEREAAAAKAKAEEEARAADRAHRGEVMKAAKEAIMQAGPVEESFARAIVLAIIAGEIPAVSLKF